MAAKSLSGKQAKSKKPVAAAPAPEATLTRISHLAASLPPSAPASASLNPLADLIDLYRDLALRLPESASPKALERNRLEVHTALHTLKAVFESLIQAGRLHGVFKSVKKTKSDSTEGVKAAQSKEEIIVEKVKAWLKERWQDYLGQTAKVAGGHWDTAVRLSALNALMSLVRTESLFLTSLHHSKQAQFARASFEYVVRALLLPPANNGVLQADLAEEWKKWWDRNDDVRYFYLTKGAELLSTFAKTPSNPNPAPLPPHLIPNAITILESLTTMPTSAAELNEFFCATPVIRKAEKITSKKRKAVDERPNDGSTGIFDSSESESESEPELIHQLNSQQRKKHLPTLLSLVAHRRAFQDYCLAILALPIREEDSKRLLIMLHRQILPHMTEPRRLMDWLVDCADRGGTVAILALNGLFTLMQKHGLEYPDFYNKLYSLLDRSVLHVRYRPRFFRLLDIFLSSSHIPSALVASFVKRLARLALSASPAAIVTVVPLVYNLLKRHPSCMVMIHRPVSEDAEQEEFRDPFDPLETVPTETNAIESSLWELAALRNHYLASVSGLATVFGEVMNKQSYAMEDFLDHSYGTMLDTEFARKIVNRPPALAPIPERQPIGDSFFPLADGSMDHIRPKKKKTEAEPLFTDDGERIEKKDDEDEEEELEPVDIVARLWSF
ncbi:nucleolar complex associated 4 [Sporobolomyces koalae]|uniref:nucleolar complex associated 4 n=1 Tax=Sporobolomyces koalae TaxID=500713 RepID=UPI00317B7D0B